VVVDDDQPSGDSDRRLSEKNATVVDLIVGRVLEVRDHPGARAPSYLLRLDLGHRGETEAQMDPGGHSKDDLIGTLLVVSLDDEAIVVSAHSHAHGSVLVRPELDVEPGSLVA
jgi:hypothetical protein